MSLTSENKDTSVVEGTDDLMDVGSDDGISSEKRKSLEEKMASWEATEEEKRAATLGGMIPGGKSGDGFDVGLWIAFPFIVGFSLIFVLFPFIMGGIDTSSVGPPPMV